MSLTFPKAAVLAALFGMLAWVLPMLGWPQAIFAVFVYVLTSFIIARW
jgi:hypothetical protein